jgi:RNA polymerase sigma-70 factor, ECF subfamily
MPSGAPQFAAVLDPEAVLMMRAAAGDDECLSQLVRTYKPSIVHYMHRMVRDRAAAEDLAQEVFVRTYRARQSYQPSARFRTWLFHIAMNVALNWIRDERHERGHLRLDQPFEDNRPFILRDANPSAESVLVKESVALEVRRAVEALPDNQRSAVLLHKYECLEYTQIADVMGCSVSAVKSLLFRAYRTLRIHLAHLEN